MQNKILIGVLGFFAFTILVGAIATEFGEPEQESAGVDTTESTQDAEPKPKLPEPKPAAEAMVRVMVFDDTEELPLPTKAEIWFRGHGSWSVSYTHLTLPTILLV